MCPLHHAPTRREMPGKKVEVAKKATFGVDDKRAQYVRLVAFNYAKAHTKKTGIKAEHEINTVPNAVLEKALTDLVDGNVLQGAEGLEIIAKYTAKGTPTGHALTAAYCAEVRPFLKRKQVADAFGHRGKGAKKGDGKKKAPASTAKKSQKKGSPKKSRAAKAPVPAASKDDEQPEATEPEGAEA